MHEFIAATTLLLTALLVSYVQNQHSLSF